MSTLSTLPSGAANGPILHAPPEKASSPINGMLLIVGCWLFLSYSILNIADTTYRATMLILILTTLLLPLLIRHLNDDLDIFEPLFYANLSLGSMFLGRPLFDMALDHWYFGVALDVKPGFDAMLAIAFYGILAFQVGYLSPLPKKIAGKLPSFPAGINYDKAAKLSTYLFVAGLVLYVGYILSSGGIGFLLASIASRDVGNQGYSYTQGSGYLSLGTLFWPPAAFVMYSAWLNTRNKRYRTLALVFLGSFFAINLGNGARSILIQGILGMIVIHYVGTGKRPGMAAILPIGVLGLIFIVGEREARNYKTFDEKVTVVGKLFQNPQEAVLSIWSVDDAAMPDYFSVMISSIPSRIPYGHFSVIKDAMIRAYPKFLWPNQKKPDEHMVYLFKLFFPHLFYKYLSGAASSVLSEFYCDYGPTAVVIGMFLLGSFFSIAKRWLIFTGNALPVQIFYIVLPSYTITLMRGGINSFLTYLAITAIPVTLLAVLASNKVKAPKLRRL